MGEATALEGLQGLHRDLVAFSESRLRNIDRLWVQLEERIEEFKRLLDKPPKNDKSRQALSSGEIGLLFHTPTLRTV